MDPEAPPLAVTDTHALIWAIDGNRKRLGKHARKQFENADECKCAIYIPALILVELGEACHKDRVTLSLPFEEWARLAFASGKYREAELTADIAFHHPQVLDEPRNSGAGNEARTRDLNLGKVALYQLSYSRPKQTRNCRAVPPRVKKNPVRNGAKALN